MTLRERALTSIRHRMPDRIPSIIDARREVQVKLAEYYGVNTYLEVLAILDAEEMYHFPVQALPSVDFPEFEEKAEVVPGPWIGGGQRYIRIDERTIEDEWGVVRRIGSDGKYVEWLTGPLVDVDDPAKITYPEPERLMKNPDLEKTVARIKEEGYPVRTLVGQPYKIAWLLRGMQNLLMDYALNPSYVKALYGAIFALQGEILRICTRAGADIVGFDGDIASKDALIMGPERWRSIDKPRLANVVDSCKAINPEVRAFIHSDGNISEILLDLIEIGFDVVDPIQPECMDPRAVKREYGRDLCLHRCGSLQRTLPFGTPKDCRAEAIELIRTCGQDGGLVLGASNTVGFDVPTENIAAWYEAVRDYRQ